MNKQFSYDELKRIYPDIEKIISENSIEIENLKEIYDDYTAYEVSYENQANFIANIFRSKESVHTVKSRVKEPYRLIEKIIRKTLDRKEKYGKDFQFLRANYKDEINDLIGIRVIHILKEQWKDIHDFIINTWKVVEITANVRDGDNTDVFKELNIEVRSRQSGYRSVHYLVEFFPTNQKVIAEIQVRTIFEEGYGEIDHRLRYRHNEIPEVLKSNLLLFNRIIGSADEMASLINKLNEEFNGDNYYKKLLKEKDEQINELKKLLKKESIL